MKDDETVVAAKLPGELLERFSEFIAEKMCLHFPRERWPELIRGVRHAAKDFGQPGAEACIHWLLSTPLTTQQIEILAGHLTVGETYFFRAPQTFEALAAEILPELIRERLNNNQRLRIWSVGCCTGEEAYSLAILASRAVPDLKHWHVTILATDINPRFLHKAEAGVFGAWSFRDAPPWLQDRYFTPRPGERHEISHAIRKMVTFFPLNLASDAYPSLLNDTNAMDLILCRNVLMYFTPAQMEKVVEKLRHCLVDGGGLVVSPNEVSQSLFSKFESVHLRNAVFYRKPLPGALEPFADVIAPVEVAAPPPPPPELPALETAHDLFDKGFYPEVLSTLGTQPSDPQAMSLMARTLANEGKLADALIWCDRAVAAAALDPVMRYLRATVLHEQGNFEEAMKTYRRALYLDHDFVLAHFALGNLCNECGHHRDARRHFRHALMALEKLPAHQVLPESEGITAGRLEEIVRTLLESGETHD